MAILSLFVIGFRSPTRLEILGACIGFFGAAITLLDQGSQQGDHTVTLWGDTLAFMGAVFVVGYLVSGRILREMDANFPLRIPSDSHRCTVVNSCILCSGR